MNFTGYIGYFEVDVLFLWGVSIVFTFRTLGILNFVNLQNNVTFASEELFKGYATRRRIMQ